jgi:hypothetical protein
VRASWFRKLERGERQIPETFIVGSSRKGGCSTASLGRKYKTLFRWHELV